MVSHYIHLMTEERQAWSKELIIRGSQERVAPFPGDARQPFQNVFARWWVRHVQFRLEGWVGP